MEFTHSARLGRPGYEVQIELKKNGGAQTQLDGCRNKGFIGNLTERNYSEAPGLVGPCERGISYVQCKSI